MAIDCEYLQDRTKVWIRVALSEADTPNAIGQGGRNLHAIRMVLELAAASVGQKAYVDLYGSPSQRSSAPREEGSERSPRGGNRKNYGGGMRRSRSSGGGDRYS
jgi:uncharacterized protein